MSGVTRTSLKLADDVEISFGLTNDDINRTSIRYDSSVQKLVISGSSRASGSFSVNWMIPSEFPNDSGFGDIMYFGSGSTVSGAVYYLSSSGIWDLVNANDAGSGSTQVLGVALGTSASGSGMLMRGYCNMTTYLTGAYIKGEQYWVHSGSGPGIKSGYISGSALDNGDDAYGRIIGYSTDTPNVVYFNPTVAE
jgi:hypothetical protein